MALRYNAEMMQDGLSRRTAGSQDEEQKKKQQQTAVPGINEAQKPKQQTPYEQRQQRIREGANRTKPVSFAAPTRTQQPEEEEERPQLSYSGGGSSARTQALEAQWFGTQEEEEPEPVTEQPRAVPQRILETESHPDREFYPTAEQQTEPRKQTAETSQPIIYTGGQTKPTGTGTGTNGAGTKAALTEPDQAWYEENGLAWAAPAPKTEEEPKSGPSSHSQQQAAAGQTQPERQPFNLWNAISQGIASSTAQQQPRAEQIAQTYAGRNTAGAQTDLQQTTAEANAIAAARRANYDYETDAERRAREGSAFTQAMGAAQRAGYSYEPDQTAFESVGVTPKVQADPDFQKYYENLKAQGMNPEAAAANASALFSGTVEDRKRDRTREIEEAAMERQGRDYQEYTQAEYDALHRQAQQQADREIEAEIGGGRPAVDVNALGAAQRAGYTYEPPANQQTGNQQTGNQVSDTAQKVTERMRENPGMPLDQALEQIMEETGAGTGSSSTSGGTSGGTSSSGSSTVPKGSTYFTPSYGQDMTRGVKAPYRAEGYTASEIEAMGNKARSDQKYYNGSKAYEGYYLAPNGKYYPVDQEKAAYYKANGGSYEGWEEPMRDYYKTFGTYYGYRPDWKTAGRSSYGGYSYSPRSYSYSRGGNSYGGSSYGSGSPANNGLYWNPNSSWSI